MAGEEHKGHGDIRKDFPGGWDGDELNAFINDGRTDEQNEAFDFLSKLLKWRSQNPVIHNGELTHYIPNDGLYVYFRYNEEKTVMIILNNKEETKKIDLEMYHENIGNKTQGHDVITNQEIDFTNGFEIEGKGAMIIELK